MLFRIFKMIATSGFLTAVECTKFVFGQTLLGELTALPRPPSWFKGNLLLRGEEGKGKVEGREGREGEKKGKGRGREGHAPP